MAYNNNYNTNLFSKVFNRKNLPVSYFDNPEQTKLKVWGYNVEIESLPIENLENYRVLYVTVKFDDGGGVTESTPSIGLSWDSREYIINAVEDIVMGNEIAYVGGVKEIIFSPHAKPCSDHEALQLAEYNLFYSPDKEVYTSSSILVLRMLGMANLNGIKVNLTEIHRSQGKDIQVSIPLIGGLPGDISSETLQSLRILGGMV